MQRQNNGTSGTRLLGLLCFLFAALLIACGPSGGGGDVVIDPVTGEARPVVKEEALKKFEEGVRIAGTNPAKAQQLFQQAVDEDSSFGEAWYNLGLMKERQGDDAGAIAAYEKATDTRGSLAEPLVNLGAIELERYKVAAANQDRVKAEEHRNKAKDYFLRVVDDASGLDPFHVQGNLNLGMIYRVMGEEVVENANDGVDMKARMDEGRATERKYDVPEDAKVHFAEAVRHVRKALAGDSNNITSYENLAAIYYDLNSLEVATLVCQQAIQKQVERNEELGKDLAAGKINQAEHDSRLITDQTMATVHNTFGLIWLARGEVALAYDSFNQAVARDANFTEALFNVAGVAVNVQDYQTAYAIYTKILTMQPDNREARLSQAVAARGLGNLDEAEKTYRAMLQKDPQYAPAKFNLGILYQEYHRDLKTAKQIYEEFAAMEGAKIWASGRIKDAEARVEQIEQIWAAQKAAEEQQRKIEEELKKMQELEKQQADEAAAEAAAEAAGEGGGDAAGGGEGGGDAGGGGDAPQ